MSNLITDFCYYHSGMECPDRYLLWAAVQMVSIVSGPRFYVSRIYDQLRLSPALYTVLVGIQGGRKSVSKDCVKDILEAEFDIPYAADVDTKTTIVKTMSRDDSVRQYLDASGVRQDYRPFCILANEFCDLLTFSGKDIINTIVGMWNVPRYKYRTDRQGVLEIENPYLTILGCATTEYITDQLKDKILTGGAARRVIFVNYTETVQRKTPYTPAGADDAMMKRIIGQLHKIQTMAGEFRWRTHEEYLAFEAWRCNSKSTHNLPHSNPNMAGFYGSMPDLVLKVMIAMALAEYDTKLELRSDLFEKALIMFGDIIPDMEQLFIGAGMNHIAASTEAVLNQMRRIEAKDKLMPLAQFRRSLFQTNHPRDVYATEEHLLKTGQIIIVPPRPVVGKIQYVISQEHLEKAERKEKDEQPPPTATPSQ